MRNITEQEIRLIGDLEDSLRKAHLTYDRNTDIQRCLYCKNWCYYRKESLKHKPDCPITLLNKMRRKFEIPNWIIRAGESR